MNDRVHLIQRHASPKGSSIYDVHTEGGWGSGSGGRIWTGDGSRPMWTPTQKIINRVHWRHPVFLSCKEVSVFFTRISSFDEI